MQLIPAGYLAKNISSAPAWLPGTPVQQIYSVSGCISENFIDNYIPFWKHNGYWLFDSPQAIEEIANDASIDLRELAWFYYEMYPNAYDPLTATWQRVLPEVSFTTQVRLPQTKQLAGFDVVSHSGGSNPECSPLSCNGVAKYFTVNANCLLPNLAAAVDGLNSAWFVDCEPGPYRIYPVYAV